MLVLIMNVIAIMIYFLITGAVVFGGAYLRPSPPFAPAAGQPGSEAIAWNDPRFSGWATSFSSYRPGAGVEDSWKQPGRAIGAAGDSVYEVVVLGDGGSITLHFDTPIADKEGPDFAVFENSFSDTFLELAFVEVSTDGEHFVRFPAYSYTASLVGSFGMVDPALIHGLAGKYKVGYGTPFDLALLAQAYALAISKPVWTGPAGQEFSQRYRDALVAAYPYLDIEHITQVRVVDIVGDGNTYDCEGFPIYDPYPTAITSGFDLDAVGVLHQRSSHRLPQALTFPAIPHQRLSRGTLVLQASADSGLSVVYQILEGPATVNGNLLSFLGKGLVTVQAGQPGNAVYAPAAPIARSFVIADELQYLHLAPLHHLPIGGVLQLEVWASSGLPPEIEIIAGPPDARVDVMTQRLIAGNTAGSGQLRIFQDGNHRYAPAQELIVPFAILDSAGAEVPQSFSSFVRNHPGMDGRPEADCDGDGFADALEFAEGTDPLQAGDHPVRQPLVVPPGNDTAAEPTGALFRVLVNPYAIVARGWHTSQDLRHWEAWRPALLSVAPVVNRGGDRWLYTYMVGSGPADIFIREWIKP